MAHCVGCGVHLQFADVAQKNASAYLAWILISAFMPNDDCWQRHLQYKASIFCCAALRTFIFIAIAVRKKKWECALKFKRKTLQTISNMRGIRCGKFLSTQIAFNLHQRFNVHLECGIRKLCCSAAASLAFLWFTLAALVPAKLNPWWAIACKALAFDKKRFGFGIFWFANIV